MENICSNNERKINMAEVTYLIYFTVMFGARAIGLFEGMMIYNISLVIGMLLFALKIAMTQHTVLEYCLIGTLLLISVLVYYNTGEKGLLLYFTMMLGLKCVSDKRVFRLAAIILSVSFTTLVLLSVTGLKEDIVYLHDRAGFGNVLRRSLGYPYPNTLFTTYIVLMVLILYVLGKQSKKNLFLSSFLLLLGAIYIYLYSCSNTGLIVSVFFLAVNIYFQLRKDISKLEKVGIQMVYPLCLIFAITGPLITKGSLFQLFDKVLHNRWAYSLYYLTNEPITLFGVRFKEAPNENYMIDSSFLYSFLQIGIIPFMILTVLFVGMIHDYVKQKKRTEIAIILSFCLLGLSDPFFFNLSYKNLMFLFVGEFLYRKMRDLETKNIGFLNAKVQLLSFGNKTITYDTPFYQKCKSIVAQLRPVLSKNSGMLTLIYLISAGAISGIFYLITQAGQIAGKIDEAPEWEYFRSAISCGVFLGILVVLIMILIIRKKAKQGTQ